MFHKHNIQATRPEEGFVLFHSSVHHTASQQELSACGVMLDLRTFRWGAAQVSELRTGDAQSLPAKLLL